MEVLKADGSSEHQGRKGSEGENGGRRRPGDDRRGVGGDADAHLQNFRRIFWCPHLGQGAVSVPAFSV
jgi:hypothetical protein